MSVLIHGINLAEPTPPGGGVSPTGGVSPSGGGGGVSPSVFSPNPTLALSANKCKDLGLFSAGGVDPLVLGFAGFVYDNTNHLMIGQGGGHADTNYDTIYAMDIANSTTFVGLYPASTPTQWAQSNYSVGQGSWLQSLGGAGPYPRPVARHTMDQAVSVGGVYICLSGVEGNADGIAYASAGGDTSHSLTGGTAYHFKPVGTFSNGQPFDFAAAGNATPAWTGCDYDPVTGKVWQMMGSWAPGVHAYDPVTKTNTVVMDGAANYYNDSFTGQHIVWAPLFTNNALVYFPPNGKMYYFTGGSDMSSSAWVPGAVYEFDPTIPSLGLVTGTSGTAMDPTGQLQGLRPGPMSAGALWGTRTYCYDSHNQLILCGPVYGKMYAYNPVAKLWSSQTMDVSGTGIDPTLNGVWTMMDYDPVDNCVIFLGMPYSQVPQSQVRVYAYRWG